MKITDIVEVQGGIVARESLEKTLVEVVGLKHGKWLLGKLTAGQKSVPSGYLEATYASLRTRIFKEHEVAKILRRLKTMIQDSLRISLLEAFHRMVPPDSPRPEGLLKEQIKAGLKTLGLELNMHEVNVMLAAFDTDAEGYVTPYVWTSVLCAVPPPVKIKKPVKVAAKPGSSLSPTSKAIPLSGTFSLSSSQAFGPGAGSSRPSTTTSLIHLHRSLSPRQRTDDSGFISTVNISKASSLEPPLDTQAILTVPPGPRLIQAAKVLTNLSTPVTPMDEERLMRSLGSLMYTGPGRHHEVLGQVDAGGVVTVRTIAGPWAKVAVDSMEGWVPMQHLDSTLDRKVYQGKDSEVKAFPASQAITASTVYLRQEPNWESRAIKKLKPGEVTEVLGVNNHWLRVLSTNGYKGWLPLTSTNLKSVISSVIPAKTLVSSTTDVPETTPLFQKWLDTMNPGVLSKQTQAAFTYKIEAKMAALGEMQYQDLGERLRKRQFRMRLINIWQHIPQSRAFK